MTGDRDDLRDLVGDDVAGDELARLEPTHRLLRSVPGPPPQVPPALTREVLARQVLAGPPGRVPVRRRSLALAAAVAAIAAAALVGVGAWLAPGGGDFEPRLVVSMEPTAAAPGAEAVLALGHRDEAGNWPLRIEVAGLPELPPGGYYVLWLERDGEYAGTCGTFRVEGARTSVTMSASYRLPDYDAWIVTAHVPGRSRDREPPRLLVAPIRT